MSIRLLARELYKAQQAVDTWQKAVEAAPPAAKEEAARELRAARKELEMLRKMLEGRKESGSFREKFAGFGRSKW